MQAITISGRHGIAGSTDGHITCALFKFPTSISVDDNQNIYIADSGNNTIRKISQNIVSTIAGSPLHAGYRDGIGSEAIFAYPDGVAVDKKGNVYVTDSDNHVVRKINSDGIVSTLAGKAGHEGGNNGKGDQARFNLPSGITIDHNLNLLYVSDRFNHTIRCVTLEGYVTTVAGSPGIEGCIDGIGDLARFSYPSGITSDSWGHVYVADRGNHVVRRVTIALGLVQTVAGTPRVKGCNDGMGKEALFLYPECVACSRMAVFVADFGNHTIRKIINNRIVVTVAGRPGKDGNTDGITSMALFTSPNGVAVDRFGNVLVTEYRNHTVRKLYQIDWCPNSHMIFPKFERDQIKAVFSLILREPLSQRPIHPQCLLSRLPLELIFKVILSLIRIQ